MFRKTTISLTLAALTTVATMSAAPALAAPADDGPISLTEVGGTLIDFTDIVSATMDGSPTETDDPADEPLCFIEDDESWTPCIDLGSLLGFPPADESETGESLTPGGVVTDVPVEVVEPESDGAVVIVDRPDLGDLFDEIYGTDRLDGLVEEATGSDDVAGSDDSATSDGVPAAATRVAGTDGIESTVEVDREQPIEDHAIDTTTTTTTVVDDDIESDEPAVAAIELTTHEDLEEGFNPLTGALFGALAALILAGAGFAAFKFGRRGA